MAMRSISHFLLALESIALVFLTAIGGIFLLGGSVSVWKLAWTGGRYFDAAIWSVTFLGLVAAWWLLLAYFYRGHKGARNVPVVVWAFAGIISFLALWDAIVGGEGASAATLFVPTFVHLSAEVWVWPPHTLRERALDR